MLGPTKYCFAQVEFVHSICDTLNIIYSQRIRACVSIHFIKLNLVSSERYFVRCRNDGWNVRSIGGNEVLTRSSTWSSAESGGKYGSGWFDCG